MKSFITFIVALEIFFHATQSTEYDVDIVDFKTNTTTPNAIDVDMWPVQVTRGVFGLSGHIYFKEEINLDRGKGQMKVYYSSNGISYQLSPFQLPPMTLAKLFNGPYKVYMMDALVKYCTDAPAEEEYVSHLRKYFMDCENLIYPSDNFPSALRPGYYKIVILFSDEPFMNVVFNTLIKVAYK